MNPRHVASLELSQRLKAAGFPQDCQCSWVDRDSGIYRAVPTFEASEWGNVVCAAPLLSEIMEAMPGVTRVIGLSPSGWWGEHSTSVGVIDGPTGPDAAALLYLALKEGR